MEQKAGMAPEVNRLYWETDQSVAEISNGLNVSRRALYDLIEPMPVGVECSSCGAEMHFANRSAKAAGIARCLVCGKERELAAADGDSEDSAASPRGVGWARSLWNGAADGRRERAVMIAGFAIVGVVFGAVATLLVRRRA